MTFYYNFWKDWGVFQKFKGYSDKSWRFTGDKYFYWTKWNEEYYGNGEISMFQGIWTNQEKEAKDVQIERIRFNKQIKDKILKVQKYSDTDVTQKYNWQIWWNLIDFKANLQCIQCQQIFWYYWMIKWLSSNSKWQCPNWRNTINYNSVFVNRRVINEIDTLISVISRQKSLYCKYHKKSWEIFCQTWNQEACCIWIIERMHVGHQLSTIDDQRESLLESARKITDPNNSVVSIKCNELKRLDENKILVDFIKNDLVNKLKDKIDSIDEELNCTLTEMHKEWSQKYKTNLEEWKEKESILKEFVKDQNNNDLFKNIDAINTLKDMKSKAIRTIRESKCSKKTSKIIDSEDQTVLNFTIDGDKLNNLKDIKLTFSLYESESKQSNYKRIKIKDSNIEINIKEDIPNTYYSKLDIKENSFCKLKDANKITKVLSDSKTYNLNDFVILNQRNQNEDIELNLTLWKETDQIERFIRETKETIKSKILDFIPDI